jgi:hypothetical protein
VIVAVIVFGDRFGPANGVGLGIVIMGVALFNWWVELCPTATFISKSLLKQWKLEAGCTHAGMGGTLSQAIGSLFTAQA